MNLNVICKLMNFMRAFDGHIFVIFVYITKMNLNLMNVICKLMNLNLTSITSWISIISFYLMVILHSTTGPYGRPMIEVAYGKILFSLHRGCMGDHSSGRVVGVSTCCCPCWTYPGQHQCGLNVYYFWVFII